MLISQVTVVKAAILTKTYYFTGERYIMTIFGVLSFADQGMYSTSAALYLFVDLVTKVLCGLEYHQ